MQLVANKDDDANEGINATMQDDAASLAAKTANEGRRLEKEMALKQQEYDAVRVKVGSLSQQTFNDMYQPNQGSAGAGSGANPYYDVWASQ